jgi:hypothetical protein
MIVYAWKQFWNDFNNGDEALFQDANLPRDDFMFKIQHWLQANKQDFRQSNKNVTIKTPELRCHQSVSAPAWTVYLMPATLIQDEKIWDPWCIIDKDWKIEIVEDGTYIIQASCQFRFSSTPSNWYQYIENVGLLKRWNGVWLIQAKSQGRVCANTSEHLDQLYALYTWWLTKWTVFTMWASHTYSSTITLYQAMTVQRLA